MRAAASRTFCTAGSKRPIRTAIIAMTTNSSINVKPRLLLDRKNRGMCRPPYRWCVKARLSSPLRLVAPQGRIPDLQHAVSAPRCQAPAVAAERQGVDDLGVAAQRVPQFPRFDVPQPDGR